MSDINSLTGLLVDFMDLPGTLDLPQLCALKVELTRSEPEPVITGQLALASDASTWGAVNDWASATGGTVEVTDPIDVGYGRPFRRVSVQVSYMGHSVRVWGHVDAKFAFPAPEAAVAR
jgi:hypothetical protein